MFRKIVIFVFALLCLATTGCQDYSLVIYNGCVGSTLTITDGDGRLLHSGLDSGVTGKVNLEAYRGERIYLLANGRTTQEGHPIGSATTQRVVGGNSNDLVSPQLRPWEIRYLYDSDPTWDCSRGTWQ